VQLLFPPPRGEQSAIGYIQQYSSCHKQIENADATRVPRASLRAGASNDFEGVISGEIGLVVQFFMPVPAPSLPPPSSEKASSLGHPRDAVAERGPWRQIAWITAGALGLFFGVRALPTGTNLSHVDFQVQGNSIEFCDPANPQFIPVVAVHSPVTMELVFVSPHPTAGHMVQATAKLTTSTGKTIGPEDVLVTHTEKLHLLIFDPELHDYQHVHPKPGEHPGEWKFSFTPQVGGNYRIFADFTPIATARGLYSNVDLPIAPRPGESVVTTAKPEHIGATRVVKDGIAYTLTSPNFPLRVRAVENFHFSAARVDGRPANFEPVMDAYAHLVAVDDTRSGFAHLHPNQLVAIGKGEAATSELDFKVSIPHAGLYVIWAQVRLDGRDRYVPFWFNVEQS
jgi:hypothetical protein